MKSKSSIFALGISFCFMFTISVSALESNGSGDLFSNYSVQLPALLLYAFLVYCLPVIIYRYGIRRYAMMAEKARWFTLTYMLCSFLVSIIIQAVIFDDEAAKHIPVLWGFVDYAILTHVSPRDIKKVNVRGFSTKLSYTDGEKEQVISQVSQKVLHRCYSLRFQDKELKKYLNGLICDKEIDDIQAAVLYQEHMKTGENFAPFVEEMIEVDSQEGKSGTSGQALPMQKYRKGWGWSVAALVAWFPFCFINVGAFSVTFDDDVGIGISIGLALSVSGLILHLIYYMKSRYINPNGGFIVAVCNLVIVSFSFLMQVALCFDSWEPPVLLLIIIPFVPLFVCYLLHLFKSYRNTTIVNRPRSTQAIIRDKEKAYEQIAKFYEYKEKGIMTEEEFERSKAQILSMIEE